MSETLNGIIKFKLYNDTVELVFNEAKHLYTVDGYQVDGTTTVLGVINKPALMPWAVKMTIEHLQAVLKPGVVYDEIQLTGHLTEAKGAYRKKSKEAADIGTLVHNWCEAYIKSIHDKTELPARPINAEANVAIDKFLKWTAEKKVQFVDSERMLYSKKWGYAGTCDFTAIIDGKFIFGDFKTSSGIWDEYWFQVAAYQQAFSEEFPDKQIDGQMIVRIGKEHADIEIEERQFSEHPDFYKKNAMAFNAALVLYRRVRELKEAAYQKKREAGYGME